MRFVAPAIRTLGTSPVTLTLLIAGMLFGAGTAPASVATAPQELGAGEVAGVIERVERAYRADGDGFSATDPGYRIRYSNAEQLVIRPRHDRPGAAAWRVRTVEARRDAGDLLSPAPSLRAADDGSLAIMVVLGKWWET